MVGAGKQARVLPVAEIVVDGSITEVAGDPAAVEAIAVTMVISSAAP